MRCLSDLLVVVATFQLQHPMLAAACFCIAIHLSYEYCVMCHLRTMEEELDRIEDSIIGQHGSDWGVTGNETLPSPETLEKDRRRSPAD
jgi:hypothetical protein